MMMIMKIFYNRILIIALFIRRKVVFYTTFITSLRTISPVKRSYTGLKLDQRRNYSTTMIPKPSVKILHPWWVTGYTDGEGSFIINTI
jgi:hypothetical protein